MDSPPTKRVKMSAVKAMEYARAYEHFSRVRSPYESALADLGHIAKQVAEGADLDSASFDKYEIEYEGEDVVMVFTEPTATDEEVDAAS